MPIDDLTALGDALRAARKQKNLTQEQLADESHVSTKQIADIEKARRNPSYLILKALAKVVHLSLDSLMYPDLSPDEAGQNEMKLLYMNCPPEMRETLLQHTRGFTEELKELSKKLETKQASERNLKVSSLAYFIPTGRARHPCLAPALFPAFIRNGGLDVLKTATVFENPL